MSEFLDEEFADGEVGLLCNNAQRWKKKKRNKTKKANVSSPPRVLAI